MLSTPKIMFIKLVGVTPQELARLHQSLAECEGVTRAAHRVHVRSGNQHTSVMPMFVEILSSKLDEENGGYVVQLRIDAALDCYIAEEDPQGRDRLLLAPRVVLDQVIAPFQGLFPELEELQRVPKAEPDEKAFIVSKRARGVSSQWEDIGYVTASSIEEAAAKLEREIDGGRRPTEGDGVLVRLKTTEDEAEVSVRSITELGPLDEWSL